MARGYLVTEKPDAILNIIDGTNIERNLYLTTQLIELGILVVMAVNMIDLVRKNGDRIDLTKLSRELGCEVIEISALKGEGSAKAAQMAVDAARDGQAGELPHVFTGSVEHALAHIEESIQGKADARFLRWYAVKLFERDERIQQELGLDKATLDHLDAHIRDCEAEMDDDAESIITNQRYAYIGRVVEKAVHKQARTGNMTVSDRIDRIVTNRILALPIFVVIMGIIYSIAMGQLPISIGTKGTDWANDVLFGEIVPGLFDKLLLNAQGEPVVAHWLYGLIQDGIVAGVGAVLGFVPQILVLCFLLAVLEDVGYMARVAFVMDRIFRRFGLSGKSFIPLLVATSAFFIGIAAVVISGVMLKKFKAFAGDPAPFVMELPAYHVPAWGNVLRATAERGWSFIKRAGTIILVSSVVLWFLQGYGFVDGAFAEVEDNNHSLLAAIGNAVAWLFYPLGWMGDMAWKATVATVTGLIAKEEVVNTFGVLYNYAGDIDLKQDSSPIWGAWRRISAPCGHTAS